MKHNLKITFILLAMFLVTQFIGIYVINHYINQDNELPFGLDSPEIEKESDYRNFFYVIIFAFAIAIAILFFLTKLKAQFVLKAWFFVVVTIALAIVFNSILPVKYPEWLAILIALPLTFFKVIKRNFLVHNFTELLIYPGIAAIFVPLLNFWTILVLLLIISAYDMWAVWHSGIMQKMAKFQINNLKIFGGFVVPYLSKKMRAKIKKLKKSKSKKKGKSIKVNIAILGGGDIAWTLIAAGVMFKLMGFYSALLVIAGATLGLSYLFFFAKKKKFYPAMPFITSGILLGMVASYLLF